MLKAWEGVFTAVSRKREPSAGLVATRQSSPCGLLKHPPPDTNTKSTDESQCFLHGGRGWIRTTEVGDVRFTV